jgi:hypothetical protein
MKIREHRGSRAESMETERECEPTIEALACAIQATVPFRGQGVQPQDVRVEPYGLDIFTGKRVFIITLVGKVWKGVWGFCDTDIPNRNGGQK